MNNTTSPLAAAGRRGEQNKATDVPSVGMSALPAPPAEPDPEPEPPTGEQEMMAVCAQCGIEVTHHQLQDTIREREGEPFRTNT